MAFFVVNYQLFSIEMSCLNARDFRNLLLVTSMQRPLSEVTLSN